jgi:hypothetical protein
MSRARHEGPGRATRPAFGLDPARRRKIVFALIRGGGIGPTDETYARDKASRVASRIPHGLFMGLVFGVMAASSVKSLFPLTAASTALLIFGAACVLTYLICLTCALRIWWWLRRRS